jgi:hypothetical protein
MMRRHLRSAILVGLFVASGVVTGACDWWNGKKTAPTTTETAPAQGAATSPPVRLGDQGHYQRKDKKGRVVVFVHGVYGSAMTTWKSPDGKTSWPELMAGNDTFKNSDI